MADIRAGDSVKSQAVTVKVFHELLDSFSSALLDTIEKVFSKNSLGNHKELLEGQQEISQRSLPLEEAVWIKRQAGTVETKVWADASTQLIEKQQIDSLLQADKLYGNKFWLYGQRTELNDYISKNSWDGDFKLKKVTSRRERVSQKHQPQINILKFSKIKLGGTLQKLTKKKDWKKYRKKRSTED